MKRRQLESQSTSQNRVLRRQLGGGKVINHALTFAARRETNNFFPSCLLNIGFGVIVGISNYSLTYFLTSSSFRCF